jgi:RNA polymerase sigma-32 factor
MHTMSLPVPSIAGAGSLESYIQAVNRFPLLTAEEEFEYGRRLKYDQDLDAARHLVLSHLRLVVSIARQYVGYGLPQADLVQEGNVGLMKAVRRFDPDRGVRLVSFAVHWIRAEIHEYVLRNWRLVKIATTKAQRKLFFNLRGLKQSLASLTHKETEEIARKLQVRPEDVTEMETRLYGQDVPLEPGVDEDEETYSPIAYLADPSGEPSELLERQESGLGDVEGLKQALASLDPRSRRIIEARWLRETDTATLHDLAGEFGVSAERIRQIEQKAMLKMRTALAEQR